MTAALEGSDWSAARPGRTLPPAKTRYPFYRRLGGPQGLSGRPENLVPTGIRSRTVQPVVRRYTEWATPTKPDSIITQKPQTKHRTRCVNYITSNWSCNLMLHIYIYIPDSFLPRTSFNSNCCTKIFFTLLHVSATYCRYNREALIWIILVILHIH